MRISDWSSDVCSSDLRDRAHSEGPAGAENGVCDQRSDRGIETDLGWKSGEHRIGEALRYKHDGDNRSRHEIAGQRRAIISARPAQHRPVANHTSQLPQPPNQRSEDERLRKTGYIT